jgi:repressor LexA
VTRAALSPVEREVYHFLLDFLSEHTFQPSVREIAKELSIPSTKSVADLLASLEKKGYVEREAGRSRGVAIVGFAGGTGTIPVPVVRADGPRSELRTEDHLTLDRRLVAADDTFLIRASHEDAPAHAVRAGDLILVQPSTRAKDGDVVVVRAANTVVVRAMTRRGATLHLVAPGQGSDLDLGPGDDSVVLGVVAGGFRTTEDRRPRTEDRGPKTEDR